MNQIQPISSSQTATARATILNGQISISHSILRSVEKTILLSVCRCLPANENGKIRWTSLQSPGLRLRKQCSLASAHSLSSTISVKVTFFLACTFSLLCQNANLVTTGKHIGTRLLSYLPWHSNRSLFYPQSDDNDNKHNNMSSPTQPNNKPDSTARTAPLFKLSVAVGTSVRTVV
jgi:hypothetical protein